MLHSRLLPVAIYTQCLTVLGCPLIFSPVRYQKKKGIISYLEIANTVYPFLPIFGMNASSNPITKKVAIRLNSVICVLSHPVVFALLIDVIPTLARAPTTTSAITA